MGEAIDELRETLHTMLDSEDKNHEEILKVSQELDSEIVIYYNRYYLNQ